MTVKNIFEYLNGLYPIDTACDFDNPGLLVGNPDMVVTKALISLDCTLGTIQKAIDTGCELIITHHPVIFAPLKNVLAGSIVYELIKNNIAVISMHTNLDMGDGGVNDCLCNEIGLENICAVTADDGFILKSGTLSPVSAESLAEKIKAKLGGRVKYVDGGKIIEKVLVCSGSGGEFLNAAIKGNFDALVTADVKHHEFLQAFDNGISLFDAGHFNTEDIVLEPLCVKLKKKFSKIAFTVDHTSNINYK